ncbi:hypothetical protein, partial [Pseudoalteromonas sp. SG45-1]|uniref:hypothetical protein n=1 Tax=Pseudoalteromonas sp. SG45-1 TaxID=2760957 RepID=UPI001C7286CD
KRLRGASLLEENKLNYPGKNINIEQLFGSSSLLLYPHLLLILFSLCKRSLSTLFTKRLRSTAILKKIKIRLSR